MRNYIEISCNIYSKRNHCIIFVQKNSIETLVLNMSFLDTIYKYVNISLVGFPVVISLRVITRNET